MSSAPANTPSPTGSYMTGGPSSLLDKQTAASRDGATLIGITDPDDLFAGDTVNEALLELAAASLPEATIRRVRGCTTSNMASFTGVSTTFDGLTLVEGDRILVRGQSTASQNGIYVVGEVTAGTADWTRAADMAAADVQGTSTLFLVAAGTVFANTVHKLTNTSNVTIGTTALTFETIKTSTELASTANGKGASLVGIEDSGGKITATTVEGALAEIATNVNAIRTVAAVVGAEGAVAANAREVACTVTDLAGTTIAAAVEVLVESIPTTADKGHIAAAGTPVGTLGAVQNPATGASVAAFTTTAGGLFSFRITNDQVENNEVRITVNGGLSVVLKLAFA